MTEQTEQPEQPYELAGWPFRDHAPIRYGVDGRISWAVAVGGTPMLPNLCGYARIPWEGHPWSGCTCYDDLDVQVHGGLTFGPYPEIRMGELARDLEDMTHADPSMVPFRSPVPDDHTMPAVTFTDVGGWIGFDTGHTWDYWSDEALAEVGVTVEVHPKIGDLRHLSREDPFGRWWTLELVIREAKFLAAQVSVAGRKVDLTKREGAKR